MSVAACRHSHPEWKPSYALIYPSLRRPTCLWVGGVIDALASSKSTKEKAIDFAQVTGSFIVGFVLLFQFVKAAQNR